MNSPAQANNTPELDDPPSARVHDRGALAREQLIAHAARIFSGKGYAAASTREICEAAGVNLASIHYYFGDKEGLYRAVLLLPIKEMTAAFGSFDDPKLSFEDALRMLFAPFMSHEERADQLDTHLMRLHLREMTEPSTVFREIVKVTIAPVHESICSVLARHCGLARHDVDIQQLAFALVAIANDYCMSREFMSLLAPDLLDRQHADQLALDRLVGYGRALLDYEIARRRAAAPIPTRSAEVTR
jgi:AcrR family transcriptional regulator